MTTHEFLSSTAIIIATLALASAVELAWPLFQSTRVQHQRRVANLGLMVGALLLNWMLTSVAALVALALPGPQLIDALPLPWLVEVVASLFILDFFFGYLAHRALHMLPSLWRVHRVHHSDPFVDATTTYRTHPLEVAWRFAFLLIPIWTLGVPAAAVLAYRLLSAINGTLEHANIRISPALDAAVSLVWVTPNMHKIHHSRDQIETDSNYGNLFAIPDRLCRTFTPTRRALAVTYGLDDVDPQHATSFRRLVAMPFAPRAALPPLQQPASA